MLCQLIVNRGQGPHAGKVTVLLQDIFYNLPSGCYPIQTCLEWNAWQFLRCAPMLAASHHSQLLLQLLVTTMMDIYGPNMPSWWKVGAGVCLDWLWCSPCTRVLSFSRPGPSDILCLSLGVSWNLAGCARDSAEALGSQCLLLSRLKHWFVHHSHCPVARTFQTVHATVCVVAGKSDPSQLVAENRSHAIAAEFICQIRVSRLLFLCRTLSSSPIHSSPLLLSDNMFECRLFLDKRQMKLPKEKRDGQIICGYESQRAWIISFLG